MKDDHGQFLYYVNILLVFEGDTETHVAFPSLFLKSPKGLCQCFNSCDVVNYGKKANVSKL